GDPKIDPALRDEDSVGDAEKVAFAEAVEALEVAEEALILLLRGVGRVNVGRAVVDRDLIGELAGCLEVVDRQLEFAGDGAGVPPPHPRRPRNEVQIPAPRHSLAEEL